MTDTIQNVTVIGAGLMGSGIAEQFIKNSYKVVLTDNFAASLDRGYAKATERITKKIEKVRARNPNSPKIGQYEAQKALLRKEYDLVAAVKNADCVIEAVTEDLAIKRQLFHAIDQHVPQHALLASNTSALSIDTLAASMNRPERFIGMHFFNPPAVMKLVELVVGARTSQRTYESAAELASDIGKTGIRCKDSPGFIVNRVLIPVLNEAFWMLEPFHMHGKDYLEVAASIDEKIVEDGYLPMGPLRLGDLVGLDTALHALKTLESGLQPAMNYKPAPLLERLVHDGHIGRKLAPGSKNTWSRGVYWYDLNDPRTPRDKTGKTVCGYPQRVRVGRLYAVAINEALGLMHEHAAGSSNEIDTAVKLGAGWSTGPLELIRKLGGYNSAITLAKDIAPHYRINALYAGTHPHP